MSLTASEYKDMIPVELNDPGIVRANIEQLWRMYDTYASTPHIQYLQTKLRAIDMLLGTFDQSSYGPGPRDLNNRDQERISILMMLRRATSQALLDMGGGGYTSNDPSVGVMTRRFIIESTPPAADPNSSWYIGDPTARRGMRSGQVP